MRLFAIAFCLALTLLSCESRPNRRDTNEPLANTTPYPKVNHQNVRIYDNGVWADAHFRITRPGQPANVRNDGADSIIVERLHENGKPDTILKSFAAGIRFYSNYLVTSSEGCCMSPTRFSFYDYQGKALVSFGTYAHLDSLHSITSSSSKDSLLISLAATDYPYYKTKKPQKEAAYIYLIKSSGEYDKYCVTIDSTNLKEPVVLKGFPFSIFDAKFSLTPKADTLFYDISVPGDTTLINHIVIPLTGKWGVENERRFGRVSVKHCLD